MTETKAETIIVTESNFSSFCNEIRNASNIVLDTETTGLNSYKGDKPFLLQVYIPTIEKLYVLNLYASKDCKFALDEEHVDLVKQLYVAFQDFTFDKENTIIGHNIKFDLHMLYNYFLNFELDLFPTRRSSDLKGKIIDTMSLARVVKNDLPSYSLQNLSEVFQLQNKKIGDEIGEYMKEHKGECYEAGRLSCQPLFNQVPFDLLVRYGAMDCVATWELFGKIKHTLIEFVGYIDKKNGYIDVFRTEIDITKVLFFVELRGVNIDMQYIDESQKKLTEIVEQAKLEYSFMTNEEFIDSNVEIPRIFKEQFGIECFKTKKGNYSISEAALNNINHPLADIIIKIRNATKKRDTFFSQIKEYTASDGVLHPSYVSCGANTLRMSTRTPNTLNMPREDAEFSVRRCFIAPNGRYFVSTDYAAQEFRVALDQAGEHQAIKKILAGIDPHGENAKKMGCDRNVSKQGTFGWLYGAGAATIAKTIGKTYDEATKIRNDLRKLMPAINKMNYMLQNCVEISGYILTCYGNPLFCDTEFAYKATNQFIQGSCAIMTKKAAIEWDNLSNELGTGFIRFIIHDEIIADFAMEDKPLLPRFCECMTSVYKPKNGLPMGAEPSEFMGSWKKC